jgi:RimJ/RimL family protein N-acetyltransferase/N-acetylglutamate synthase-like GNAT family acetyltransferase
VRLRRLTERDAPTLHRSVGDPAVMRHWYPGPDGDVEQTAERIADIEAHWRRYGFGDWAVTDRSSGEIIGFAGLHYIADMSDVNIGFVLERRFWRRGLGSAVCRLVLGYGFTQLALPDIIAVIDPRNAASIGLVSKLGFSLRERCAWQGQERVVYAITRAGWEAHVAEIVPFEASMTEACECILKALPEWFGIAASNEEYIRSLPRLTTFVARLHGDVVGFVALEQLFPESAENHVLAVHPDHHRQGIGRALLSHSEQWLRSRGVEVFHVKTLGPSDPYPPYADTRAFYTAVGFRPLFETTAPWGPENPALVLAKPLQGVRGEEACLDER